MREILFRGKRVDNGEWVEGFYEQTYTYDTNKQLHRILWNDEQTKTAFCADIIPETLGQFTGLTDKNGKRIFEGDILVREQNKCVFSVFFGKHDIGCCGCCYGSHQTVGFYFSDTDDGFTMADEDEWETLELEVVGNRFDNAELLTA